MAHQLDTMAREYLARKRNTRTGRARVVFPKWIINILGVVGICSPSSPRKISTILCQSLSFQPYSMSGLAHLERHNVHISFSQLTTEAQKRIIEVLRGDDLAAKKSVRNIITHIPEDLG